MGGHPPHYTAASGNLYTFTGDEEDTESTSFHTTYRQLSSTLGRWLRPDPYDGSYDPTNPQSLNRYSYVLNNPFAFTDPLGLDVANHMICTTVTYWTAVSANSENSGIKSYFTEMECLYDSTFTGSSGLIPPIPPLPRTKPQVI